MDLSQVVKGVVMEKTCSIKEHKGAEESKNITLKVKFDGVTLEDVFQKALSATVIQWQNGQGRRNYHTWQDGQVVEISFKSPARSQVDPEQAIINKLANMSKEERIKYLRELEKKIR